MKEKQLVAETEKSVKLFYEDSYIKTFQAVVLDCQPGKDGYRIVLDRTAFFPEGGGQSGDTGFLEIEKDGTRKQIQVLDTKEKEDRIYHVTEQEILPGTAVTGTIDFAQRFERMQQHTGEHIVSGIVHSLYGYDNVGFHLGNEVTTLDFNGELSPGQVEDLENRANQAVFMAIPVHVMYPTKTEEKEIPYRSKIEIAGQVRIVEIPEIDICACCAPHVRTTAEVGLIKILSCERHRGGCRVTIAAGIRALKDYRLKQQKVTEVSVLLSAQPEKIDEAVSRIKEQIQSQTERICKLQADYLNRKLEEISQDQPYVSLYEEELDAVAIRNFVNAVVEKHTGICAAFMGSSTKGYRYILGSGTQDVRTLSKKLHEKFGGKGGGKPEMVQGSLASGNAEEIEAFLKQAL